MALPRSWAESYGVTEANAVRGGSRGQHYDDGCQAFERRQAKALGMVLHEAALA